MFFASGVQVKSMEIITSPIRQSIDGQDTQNNIIISTPSNGSVSSVVGIFILGHQSMTGEILKNNSTIKEKIKNDILEVCNIKLLTAGHIKSRYLPKPHKCKW